MMATPALADVKAGVEAWSRGDYDTAVREWRPAAINGNMDAQFNLGQAYKLGRGVPQDLAQSEEWYRKAALQGHEKAEDNYGLVMFQGGKRAEAFPWIEKSAARGEPRAQYILGTALFNGDSIAKDWVRAYALMTRASASGLAPASTSLSQMDKFIPMEQRQKGLKLAQELEVQARTRQLAQAPTPRQPLPAQAPVASGTSSPAPIYIPQPARPVSRDVDIPPSVSGPPRGASFPPAPDTMPDSPPPMASNSGPIVYTPPTSAPPRPVYTPPAAIPPVVAAPAPRPVPRVAPAPRPAAVATRSEVSGEGAWRIQLGAFSSQDRAEALWDQIEGRYSVLGSLQPYLVNLGRVTKLQAGGFSSEAAANRACSSLKAAGQACIPIPRGR